MAEEVEKYDGNNIMCPEDTVAIKEELEDDELIDDKLVISGTVISASKSLVGDCVSNYLKTTTPDIKTKSLPLGSSEDNSMINESVKPEHVIQVADDVKIEINIDNRLVFCEQCHTYYEDYCSSCGMLVHILNRNVLSNADKKVQEEIPEDILEVRYVTGRLGIFALKNIPEGVKFGPFTGLDISEFPWRIKGGEFVVSKDRSELLNWMQYIKPARSAFEQNLFACLYDDNLYYQSNREIQKGEELLVYFGEEYEDCFKEDIKMDFIPTMKDDFKDVFACTLCCLGFSSRKYLGQHKISCRKKSSEAFSVEELIQCPFCKVNLWEKEYAEHHMTYCRERNVKKCPLPTPTIQIASVKRHLLQMFKCEQCKYTTKYKSDLESHISGKHYDMKTYQCEICKAQLSTKESLRLHVENTHIYVGGKEEHIKVVQSVSQGQGGIFKCSICVFRTKHKHVLRNHIKSKHLKEYDYKCDSCEFKTTNKHYFERHEKEKHLEVFDYKCYSCEFKTNNKRYFELHVKERHLEEFDYKCDSCEFKTNYKHQLEIHVKEKHLEKLGNRYDPSEFRTSVKNNFERRIKTKTFK